MARDVDGGSGGKWDHWYGWGCSSALFHVDGFIGRNFKAGGDTGGRGQNRCWLAHHPPAGSRSSAKDDIGWCDTVVPRGAWVPLCGRSLYGDQVKVHRHKMNSA